MSIASRINEMTEHLRNDWDSIDKLGLDITEENSNDNLDKNIENIVPVLDRFYNQASDKTDLAKNGVVGKTSQDGDPTPENPVEINNLSGDVEYKVRGKNWFDINDPNVIKNSVAIAVSDNTLTQTNTGTYCRTVWKIENLKVGGTYSLSYNFSNPSGSSIAGRLFDSDNNMQVNTTVTTTDTSGTQTLTFTPSESTRYLRLYSNTTNTRNTYIVTYSNIQIEENSASSDYEPYISKSFPLSLGNIELCNISDYKDRIYSQNGKFYLEKKTGKVVFDGSENWTINTSYTYNVFYRTLGNYARILNTQTTYCEYYKGIENTAGIVDFGNNYNNSIGVRTANDNIKDIYISNNSITSASDFKTWLSTHNTEVQYVLATPTTEKITSENYPTLYSQLLAIQEFLTKYKINKEFLLDYSSPEIEY